MKAEALQPTIERALYPAYQLRRVLLLWLQRWPSLAGVLRRSDSRVVALLSLHALLAFVVAVFVPTLSLVLAPLLLGVPHLAADVRYLVLRLAAPRAWIVAVAVFGSGMLALRALQPAAALPLGGLMEHGLGGAWLVVAAVSGGVSTRRWGFSRLLALALAVGIAICALWQPGAFALVLTHGHNLVALVLWAVLSRGSMRMAWGYCLLILLAGLCLVAGAGVELGLAHGVPSAFGTFAASAISSSVTSSKPRAKNSAVATSEMRCLVPLSARFRRQHRDAERNNKRRRRHV